MPGDDPNNTDTTSTATQDLPTKSGVSGKEVGFSPGSEAGLGPEADADDILSRLDPIDDDEQEDEGDDAAAGDEAEEEVPELSDEERRILKRAGLDEDDVEALGIDRCLEIAKHQGKIQADYDAEYAKNNGDGKTDTTDGGEKPTDTDPGAFALDLSAAIETASLDLGEEDAAAFGSLIQAGVGQLAQHVTTRLEQQAEIVTGTQGLVDALVASTVRAGLREDFPEIDDPGRFTKIRDRADLLAKDAEFLAKLEKRADLRADIERDGPLALLRAVYDEAASIEFAKDGIKKGAQARAAEHGARRRGQPTRPGRASAQPKGLKEMTRDERQTWALTQLDKGRPRSEVEAELRAAGVGV